VNTCDICGSPSDILRREPLSGAAPTRHNAAGEHYLISGDSSFVEQ
jgi:hypothetical protein